MKKIKALLLALITGLFLTIASFTSYASTPVSARLEAQLSTDGDAIRYVCTIETLDISQVSKIYINLDITKNNTVINGEKELTTVYKSIAGENGKPHVENTYYAVCTVNNIKSNVDITNVAGKMRVVTRNEEINTNVVELSTNGNPIVLTNSFGTLEACVLEWNQYGSVADYNVYCKKSGESSYTLLDEKNVYIQKNDNKYRADILGLSKGDYTLKVVAKNTSGEIALSEVITNVSVDAYDRSGYAHFKYTDGVGAYKDDGTLKENAIVLYVTDENKNTVELTYGSKTVRGIGNILNTNGDGKGTDNKGILKDLANANIPLVIRFVGVVSNSGLYKQDAFDASNAPLIDGLSYYSSTINGGTAGDNGHMARMKSGKDITLEGIGENPTIDGFGFHFICEKEEPSLGKSFEVRNLKFINTPEDAVGMEGQQDGSTITASVERCWVHNNEFYCPNIIKPAQSDKAQGDGSCDFKRGQYFTCSYNYYEACHKTNLIGSKDDVLQYNLSYHHNHYYLVESRGPLTRNANVHMYNNFFEGQTAYAMNTRANAYIFSEYNLFYMCKSPQRVESGAIKSYNDSFSSCIDDMTGTVVTDKSQAVANNCGYNGIDYSKFDTDPNLSYIPQGDYELQESITEARKVIYAKTGVVSNKSIDPNTVTMSQISLLPNNVTPVSVTSASQTLTPGKISKTVYAMNIKTPVLATIEGSGYVVVNEAGEVAKVENGAYILEGGIYMIQAMNFQPGKPATLTEGTFKDITVSSVKFTPYNSEELNLKLIKEYDDSASAIPTTITYTDSTLASINLAKEAYSKLKPELQLRVTVPYSNVEGAYSKYLELGKSHVEGLISSIGSVNETSGSAIIAARSAYDKYNTLDGKLTISNYQVLTNAESTYANYAVSATIAKINAIGTVEYTLECNNKITDAENAYNALSATQKSQVTNYNTLQSARNAYNQLEAVNEYNIAYDNYVANKSIENANLVIEKYNQLTPAQQATITTIDSVKVELVIMEIDTIPTTITLSDSEEITRIDDLYNSLDTSLKQDVTNVSKLTNAKAELQKLQEELATTVQVLSFDSLTSANNISSGIFSSATVKGDLESCTTPVEVTVEGIKYTFNKYVKFSGSTSSNGSDSIVLRPTQNVTVYVIACHANEDGKCLKYYNNNGTGVKPAVTTTPTAYKIDYTYKENGYIYMGANNGGIMIYGIVVIPA